MSKLTPLIVIIIFILILSLPLLSYFSYRLGFNSGNKALGDTEVKSETTDESDKKSYLSKNFKMTFTYPSKWGDVTENLDEINNNKEIEITFTDNPYIELVGINANYDLKGMGIGEVCPIFKYFNGWENTDRVCTDNSNQDIDLRHMGGDKYFGCSESSLGTGSQVYYYGPSMYCAGTLGFMKIVDINTPNTEFPGVRAMLSTANSEITPLALQAEYYMKIEDYELFGIDDYNKGKDYYYQEYEATWNSIKNGIMDTNENKDYLAKEQLSEFEAFLNTIEFNQ
ncbi:MAG: hypothetical protein PHS44_07370 [Candidatus Dojkabacteria bacterium]|nr:hypothetical protein [Candidatus Dojkabacteria bacterium]